MRNSKTGEPRSQKKTCAVELNISFAPMLLRQQPEQFIFAANRLLKSVIPATGSAAITPANDSRKPKLIDYAQPVAKDLVIETGPKQLSKFE